jgi:hypothetical protein
MAIKSLSYLIQGEELLDVYLTHKVDACWSEFVQRYQVVQHDARITDVVHSMLQAGPQRLPLWS